MKRIGDADRLYEYKAAAIVSRSVFSVMLASYLGMFEMKLSFMLHRIQIVCIEEL